MNNPNEDKDWYVEKDSQIMGPKSWMEIEVMLQYRDLSKTDSMKSESDSRWYPVADFFPDNKESVYQDEVGGVLPKLSDAIFILGLLGFFIGAGLFFVNNYLGDVVLLLSLGVEIWGVYYSKKNEPKAITKNVGNAMALGWTVFQGIITVFFILFTFS